jgi:RNA polymerase sigma factor (sigma-70 family)
MLSVRTTGRSAKATTRKVKSQKAVTKPAKKIDRALEIAALQHRVRGIKELKIEYIASPDFKKRSLEKLILGAQTNEPTAITQIGHSPQELPSYVASLYDTTLLGKDEESHLFRQMNYLKYRADRLRKKLSLTAPDVELMDRIQRLLVQSDRVKARIIQANLRLVVSIAKKFVDPANHFDDLVSDGNLSLIRAVEKFNYILGNRFSTYATYAIQRNYFRVVVRSRKQRTRFLSDDEGLQAVPQAEALSQLNDTQFSTLQQSFGRILERLNDREQIIIRQRFGFGLDDTKTFKELGQELGVCKERIRQIQARAMQKIRKYADEERLLQQFEDHVN